MSTPRESRAARAALWRHRLETVATTRAEVAKEYGLHPSYLEGNCRIQPAPEARREVMTRLWELGLSLSEIGRLLSLDPSTVCSAVRKSMGDEYRKISPGPGKVRPMPDLKTLAKEEAAAE